MNFWDSQLFWMTIASTLLLFAALLAVWEQQTQALCLLVLAVACFAISAPFEDGH